MKIPYWYAGFWVHGCETMEYKTRFRPCEVLGTDGVWREMAEFLDEPAKAPVE
jgi:arginyl-tRNA--protein-N-Asp/Glu arginylyltransferase